APSAWRRIVPFDIGPEATCACRHVAKHRHTANLSGENARRTAYALLLTPLVVSTGKTMHPAGKPHAANSAALGWSASFKARPSRCADLTKKADDWASAALTDF